ncbi:16S rRNA (cytidine(1402)-2'-O)-methyltransferase [Aquicoccus sp.]|uniref:16S rRNA (cytidine(1402)-2'-O)-methyltransferase n=1 Tax=Aquicoccus sp. TaxID=2055851 RepID=UPI003566E1F0
MVNPKSADLDGGLYLVSVPIGTARDITLRALDILADVDVIAAEDTRSMRRLLDIHGVVLGDRPLIAYHDHNGPKVRPKLLQWLREGRSVAYASEAGTPMVADPGFDLVRAAREDGTPVTAAPGPVAAIVALTLSGLPTDRFLFAGFLPSHKGRRKSALQGLTRIEATLILYESPKRCAASLADMASVLGGDRPAALCRELTKKFEEVRRGTLTELAAEMAERPVKGEVVLVVAGADGDSSNLSSDDVDSRLKEVIPRMSLRDGVDLVAAESGMKRRQVYQRALDLIGRDVQEDQGGDGDSGAVNGADAEGEQGGDAQ